MDLLQIPLFAASRQRLAWLDRRQEVLAHNVANADTPGYRPRDIEPFAFEAVVRRQGERLALQVSDDGHRTGTQRSEAAFGDASQRRPYETAPAGNAVILEEQMAKVNETALAHDAATGLYRKYLGMIRLAIGERR